VMPDCTPAGGSDQRQARRTDHHHAKGEDDPIVDNRADGALLRRSGVPGEQVCPICASSK
jgi:hypothetical protein